MAFNKRDWANGERITEGLLDDLEQRIETGLAEVPIEVTDPLVSTLVDDDFSTTTSSIKARVEGWVADGTIPTADPAALTVTETQPGAYALESGSTSATIYGLTAEQTLPPAAESKLAADLGNSSSSTGGSVSQVVSTAADALRSEVDAGYAKVGVQPVNVKHPKYGYVKDADNTATIEAAWADANAQGRALYFPEGPYNYNGPGLTGINPNIHGAGRAKTVIKLGATSRLFDISGTIGTVDLGDFTSSGGLGVFRSTYTGNSVAGLYRVTNVEMKGYTSAAVEVNANDMPYWKFRDCIFDGANFTTTMGVALSGLTDGCSFENCEFLRNRVHIKMRYGGNNAYIRNCDFLRFGGTQGQPRVDVWLVPRSGATNSGAGFTLDTCKFGAENLHADDKRIVYADEGAGATNAEKFPVLDTPSTGVISGHNVRNVMMAGISTASFPLVFSTTPDVRGCSYSNINLQGTPPEYIVQFLVPPTRNRLNGGSIIGPIIGADVGVENGVPPLPSNADGFATIFDPNGLFAMVPGGTHPIGSGSPTRYKQLLRTPTAAYNASGAVTLTEIPDSLGGVDARTVASTGGSLQVSVPDSINQIITGEPVWIEFDARSATLGALRFRVEQSGGLVHHQRLARLGASWYRYRFLWDPRVIGGSIHFMFAPYGSASGTFDIGRVRAYHASEPLNVDGLTVIDGTVYRLSVTNGVLGATAV